MAPDWIMAAVIRMKIDWTRKEATRVLRRKRPSNLQPWEKQKQPKTKKVIEVSDLAHPYGFLVEWEVEPPRPRKMVLPG